ncbi:MAG: MBL fold metallo-hydrolase [Myxococcaceae bacterium]|nr:MAG: MBL fold metallo-hydrolase [Myxococcaceae bacterium]
MARKEIGILLLLLSGASSRAQPEFDQIQIRAERVAGNVHVLYGGGGNIGVSVGPDGVLLVDDQYAPLAPKIRAALRTIAGDRPVRFVLNTHWHGDHTGGNEIFGETAPIIAQENVRKRLVTGGVLSNGRRFEPAPEGALPIITFDRKLSVHVNDEEIRGLHLERGHTDGDVVVYFTRSNVVHMGDQFVSGGFLPFVDFNSGGDLDGLIANIDQVIGTVPDDVRVIPGHGAVAGKPDLVAYSKMLKDTRAALRRAKSSRGSLEALLGDPVFRQYGWPEEEKRDFLGRLYRGIVDPR